MQRESVKKNIISFVVFLETIIKAMEQRVDLTLIAYIGQEEGRRVLLIGTFVELNDRFRLTLQLPEDVHQEEAEMFFEALRVFTQGLEEQLRFPVEEPFLEPAEEPIEGPKFYGTLQTIAMLRLKPEWKLKPFTTIPPEAILMEKRCHTGAVFGNAKDWIEVDARRSTRAEVSIAVKKQAEARGNDEIRKVFTTPKSSDAKLKSSGVPRNQIVANERTAETKGRKEIRKVLNTLESRATQLESNSIIDEVRNKFGTETERGREAHNDASTRRSLEAASEKEKRISKVKAEGGRKSQKNASIRRSLEAALEKEDKIISKEKTERRKEVHGDASTRRSLEAAPENEKIVEINKTHDEKETVTCIFKKSGNLERKREKPDKEIDRIISWSYGNPQPIRRADEQLCMLNGVPAIANKKDRTICEWWGANLVDAARDALSRDRATAASAMAANETIGEQLKSLAQEEESLKRQIKQLLETRTKSIHALQRRQRRVEKLKKIAKELEDTPVIEENSDGEEETIKILHSVNTTKRNPETVLDRFTLQNDNEGVQVSLMASITVRSTSQNPTQVERPFTLVYDMTNGKATRKVYADWATKITAHPVAEADNYEAVQIVNYEERTRETETPQKENVNPESAEPTTTHSMERNVPTITDISNIPSTSKEMKVILDNIRTNAILSSKRKRSTQVSYKEASSKDSNEERLRFKSEKNRIYWRKEEIKKRKHSAKKLSTSEESLDSDNVKSTEEGGMQPTTGLVLTARSSTGREPESSSGTRDNRSETQGHR
ncbi:enolase-phosphatase E1-like [Linepithema humile]|uniref:enolase-phosphatase E1-like n=1 Tax=Linepithema humile TaxID=83485 RepID=UPI00351E837B